MDSPSPPSRHLARDESCGGRRPGAGPQRRDAWRASIGRTRRQRPAVHDAFDNLPAQPGSESKVKVPSSRRDGAAPELVPCSLGEPSAAPRRYDGARDDFSASARSTQTPVPAARTRPADPAELRVLETIRRSIAPMRSKTGSARSSSFCQRRAAASRPAARRPHESSGTSTGEDEQPGVRRRPASRDRSPSDARQITLPHDHDRR